MSIATVERCVALHRWKKATFDYKRKQSNEHTTNSLIALLNGQVSPFSYGLFTVHATGLADRRSWSLPTHVLVHWSLWNSELVVDLHESIMFRAADGLLNVRTSNAGSIKSSLIAYCGNVQALRPLANGLQLCKLLPSTRTSRVGATYVVPQCPRKPQWGRHNFLRIESLHYHNDLIMHTKQQSTMFG